MASRKRLWNAVATLLAGVTLNGCAEPDAAAPAALQAAAPVTPATLIADAAPSATDDSTDEKVDDAAVDINVAARADEGASSTASSASTGSYEPPFPDRVDLFVAPKRQEGASGSQDSSDRVVELMGFVRVDRPRAILTINGETNALAVGESIDGIEVISVQPPSVVLRRGRQRWQATIE